VSVSRNIFRASSHPIASMNGLSPSKIGLPGLLAILLSLGMPAIANRWLWAAPKASAPPPAKDLAVPFHVGETLNYHVTWAAFATAASLEVSVPERRNLFGWATWHFRAALHTQNPVRTLFIIDDQFDSYADAATLETRQFESYLDELGRSVSQVLHFVPVGQTSRAPGPDTRVLPGTRDPVGVFYALRGVDWQRTREFRAPLYDGHNVYQLAAKLEAKNDTLTVAAGTFSASRIAVRLSSSGARAPDINFGVWLANNPARTPVQFQAELPFGNVRAELAPAR